ncbi:MAG: cytochrome c peroxidase [Burkholderiales bacterium]
MSAAAQVWDPSFHDVTLSASGSQSCATCHNPERAHAGVDGRAVPLGGAAFNPPGFCNAPSLRYLAQNPAYFFDDEGTPTGGFNRDGRAQSLAEQARRPLSAAHEMANASAANVVNKLQSASYVEEFRAAFGADVFTDADTAFAGPLSALEKYQQERPEFNPFTSKYDYFLKGQSRLSDREIRGLALFNGSLPLFTNFTYDNVGVPRNLDIPAPIARTS